ncbi:MAG: MFS transporter [Rickettsiales bacterium]|jgi:MFS family permease|nr:MFS transporter [Rickettsiales bacterium]
MFKKSKPGLRNFLTSIYGFSFFNCLVFFYPVYALFFVDNGMTDSEISLLFIIWTVAQMAAQVPIGIASSRIPLKHIVIFGQIMKMGGFFIWYAWPTFLGFAIGFMMWGVMCGIYNAVFESMVYDELKGLKQKKIYAKICGRKSAVETVGYLLSTTGSLMLFWGYAPVVWLSLAMLGVSVLFMMNMKSAVKITRSAGAKFLKTIKMSMRILGSSAYVTGLLFIVSAITAVSFMDDYLGLIGTEMGLPKEFVGATLVVTGISRSLGNIAGYKFENARNFWLGLGIAAMGCALFGAAAVFSIPALGFFGLFYFLIGLLGVMAFSKFQHAISSNCRTVVLCINDFLQQFMSIFVYSIVGFGVAFGSYKYSLWMLGAACVAVGLLAMVLNPKKPAPECRIDCGR